MLVMLILKNLNTKIKNDRSNMQSKKAQFEIFFIINVACNKLIKRFKVKHLSYYTICTSK